MIKRFNLYKEGSFKTDSELTARWLGPNELKFIETKENDFYQMIEEMIKGNRCLGLVNGGEVVTYLWINDKHIIYYGLKIPLKKNECYIYNSITKPDRKGKGYAGILRAKCYDILREQGKDTFYSITDKDNEPALRMKEKIKAEIVDSYLFIGLWKFKYLRHERI